MSVTEKANEQIKNMLLCSGIKFDDINEEEIITMCKSYDGGMNYLTLNEIVKAISEIYEDI